MCWTPIIAASALAAGFSTLYSLYVQLRHFTPIVSGPSVAGTPALKKFSNDSIPWNHQRTTLTTAMHRSHTRRFNPYQSSLYEAVSYAWGCSTNLRQTITCNGQMLSLTQVFFFEALQVVRRPESGQKRALWADSICIYQGDVVDRSH